MTAKKILLAGGGTAGHVNPLLATAQELERRGYDICVIGTVEGLEAELVPDAGFPLVTLPKVPIPRRPSPSLLTVPTRLRSAVHLAREYLREADALVGFGGYVSAPAYIAAANLGVPFVVQEQNVRPGWANRLGARKAAAVSLAFPQTPLKASKGSTVFTGLPLRRSIEELAESRKDPAEAQRLRTDALEAFGLDPALPTLLVTGGSLGAAHLNEVVAAAAPHFAGKAQILHATGRGKLAAVAEVANANPDVMWVIREYISNMEVALAAADLVLCRSGAGTVAELAALGLPAFYVPLPIGNGEQRRNAEQQLEVKGARLVEDRHFTADTVLDQVLPLLLDRPKLEAMSVATRSTSPGNGAVLLSDLVESTIAGTL